jgi:hypothetical protein
MISKINIPMENKYYTPDIEDFNIGYIGERRVAGYPNEEWTKFEIKIKDEDGTYTDDIVDVIDMFDDGGDEFRTKYLDREDIESLGWKYDDMYRDGGTTTYYFESKEKLFDLHFSGTNKMRPSQKIVIFENKSTKEKYSTNLLFTADIKSINELKTIMKLLNIK